jgi:membrane protein implicated in regulation of membrane protease activity
MGARAIFRAPASRTHVGATGVAIEPLAPTGYVRIGGELWEARAMGPSLEAGASVVVRTARGLTLLGEAATPAAGTDRKQGRQR